MTNIMKQYEKKKEIKLEGVGNVLRAFNSK